jgi:alginate O-acetyltransferase complex protein AlgI
MLFIAKAIDSSKFRNLGLLIISLFFYLWGEASNVFLLIFLGWLNYKFGSYIEKTNRPRYYLAIFIAINLLALIGCKYSYWLLSFIFSRFENKPIKIPIGISFFTFHAISYLIDIYRKKIKPSRTMLNFLTYFCMFPHLVAGPIVRYSSVENDLENSGSNFDLFSFGLFRFLLGLNKKVILANTVSLIADNAFTMSWIGTLNGFDAWIGIIAYTMQIYFDFSGYSDMAIGLAAMAGFKFDENFLRPYSSLGIRDFWRRWHISLSSWLLDYLYIPLGGSRVKNLLIYRNLLIVFLICGIWHGANLTFVIWGLWHGSFLIFERIYYKKLTSYVSNFVIRIYTIMVIIIGWVFFRSPNLHEAVVYLRNLFSFSLNKGFLLFEPYSGCVLIISILICFIPQKYLSSATSKSPLNFSNANYIFQLLLSIISVILLLAGMRNPFIYFNF